MTAALIGCGLSVSAVAQGTGFSLVARVSERIDVQESNTISNTGFSLASSTGTPRSQLDINAGFNLFAQTSDSDINLVNPNLSLGYQITGKRVTFDTSAALSVQPVQYTDVDANLNVIDREGLRRTLTGSAGFSVQATRNTAFSLNGSISDTDFDDASSALTPSRTSTVSFGVSQTLTQSLSIGSTFSYSYFTADDALDTEADTIDVSANLSYRPSRDLSLSADIGVARTETDETLASGRRTRTDDNILFGAGLSYAASADTTFTANLSQTISPSSTGALGRNTIARIGLDYAINDDSSLDFQLTGSRQDTLGGNNTSDAVQFGANYSRQLDRLTNARVGYTVRRVTGSDVEHRLLFQISRDFNLLN